MLKSKEDKKRHDELWRGIITDLPDAFLQYFFPKLAPEIDFAQIKFLDKELPETIRNMKGEGRVDLIIQAPLKNTKNNFAIFHTEILGYEDRLLAERMFTYYYRLRDLYGPRIASLVIFTENNPDFHPKEYFWVSPFGENTLSFTFETFKILEKSDNELNVKGNIFSFAMLAAKKAIEYDNS